MITAPAHCPCVCGTPPDRTMTFGCVREHMGSRNVCANGEALGRNKASRGLLWCTDCNNAGYPEVPMTLLDVRPLEGTTR